MFYFTESESLAKGEEYKRDSWRRIAQIREEKRQRKYGAINQGLKIAASLWKAYENRSKLFDFAESKGLESANGKVAKWFTPNPKFRFTNPGQAFSEYTKTVEPEQFKALLKQQEEGFSAETVLGAQALEDLYKTNNLFDLVVGGLK